MILISSIFRLIKLSPAIIIVSFFLILSCDNSTAQQKTSSKPTEVLKNKDLLKAPDFSLADLEGNIISLSDLRGKVVLLNFWGTWCGPCKREIPDFVNLMNKYKKQGLEIVGVTLTSGSSEKIQSFARQWDINYTLLTDIKSNETQVVTSMYGQVTGERISGIPTSFIIDRNGFIQKRYVGPRSENIFYNDIKPFL